MGTQSHCPASLPGFSDSLLSTGHPSVRPLSGDTSSDATSYIRKITQGGSYKHDTTIGMLPDNVLLEVFDFCREDFPSISRSSSGTAVWKWHLLAHVCGRWRQIIFESPRRLNLQIRCTYGTPVRKNLGIWPALPIAVEFHYYYTGIPRNDEDDVIAALEHPDRVYYLGLHVTGSQLENMATVMQEPFPVLTHLYIGSYDRDAPVLPAEFLGGSAPCLQVIYLLGIAFPALPTLLLSASDLVELELHEIPPSGYILPEVMVSSLATLYRLEIFVIQFQLATSHPDRIHPPPVTRAVLPALTRFVFQGPSKYLEDLVAHIDSPQLCRIVIDYLNRLVDFQVARFSEFVDRSIGPKFTPFGHASVSFYNGRVTLGMCRSSLDRRPPDIFISCEAIDWDFSHIAQVFSQSSTTLSNVVHLGLMADPDEIWGFEDPDDADWPHLLQQFSTVQTLCVSQELAGHVAFALEHITGEMVDEVLPSLYLICLADQPASSIEKFVATRRLSGRPVTVADTEKEFDERLGSYVGE